MIVAILQPSYLPWLGFFDLMLRADCFVYHDNLAFDKSWRNRNRIRTGQGAAWITVPVQGPGLSRTPLTRVRVDHSRNWPRRQWNLIRENYRQAPFFGTYGPALEELICDRKWERLLDLTYATTDWLLACLDIHPVIRFASELDLGDTRKNERILRICRGLGADTWLANSVCREYVDPELYRSAGVRVTYQDYEHPVYPQLFEPFLSHLSVIDLLFNCGPESLAIIRGGPGASKQRKGAGS